MRHLHLRRNHVGGDDPKAPRQNMELDNAEKEELERVKTVGRGVTSILE
jgi:hypothetical protein